MNGNFQHALAEVLREEGGFVNHPADPGGMTNLGVTRKVWEEWVGHPVSEKEMRRLTPALVAPMYKAKYWDRISGDLLPEGVDYIVFDTAVNSGPGRAIKLLQGCIGVDMDGVLGPQTRKAIAAMDRAQLIEDYGKRRLSFLRDIPTWGTFGKGWAARVARVHNTASTMIA